MVNYIPKRGDFISLNFTPQSGHEQMGKRPALFLSNNYLLNLNHLYIMIKLLILRIF